MYARFLGAVVAVAACDVVGVCYNVPAVSSINKNDQGADTSSYSLHKMAYSWYRDEHFTAVLVGDPGAYR